MTINYIEREVAVNENIKSYQRVAQEEIVGSGGGSLSGLEPTEVLFGAADGTVGQSAGITYSAGANPTMTVASSVAASTLYPYITAVAGNSTDPEHDQDSAVVDATCATSTARLTAQYTSEGTLTEAKFLLGAQDSGFEIISSNVSSGPKLASFRFYSTTLHMQGVDETGTDTATFTATNAPAAISPQKWLKVRIGSTDGYIPWFAAAP